MNHDDLITTYISRFVNRFDIWGKQWVSADGSNYGYSHQKPDMDTSGFSRFYPEAMLYFYEPY